MKCGWMREGQKEVGMRVQRQLRAQLMMALELGGSQSGPELRQGAGSVPPGQPLPGGA